MLRPMARPKRLDDTAVTSWLAKHPTWTREGEEITRTYTLADFGAALGFVMRVGVHAEKADHHPDIAIAYRKVTLRFTTHDAGGLSELDLAGAEAADSFA